MKENVDHTGIRGDEGQRNEGSGGQMREDGDVC